MLNPGPVSDAMELKSVPVDLEPVDQSEMSIITSQPIRSEYLPDPNTGPELLESGLSAASLFASPKIPPGLDVLLNTLLEEEPKTDEPNTGLGESAVESSLVKIPVDFGVSLDDSEALPPNTGVVVVDEPPNAEVVVDDEPPKMEFLDDVRRMNARQVIINGSVKMCSFLRITVCFC